MVRIQSFNRLSILLLPTLKKSISIKVEKVKLNENSSQLRNILPKTRAFLTFTDITIPCPRHASSQVKAWYIWEEKECQNRQGWIYCRRKEITFLQVLGYRKKDTHSEEFFIFSFTLILVYPLRSTKVFKKKILTSTKQL